MDSKSSDKGAGGEEKEVTSLLKLTEKTDKQS